MAYELTGNAVRFKRQKELPIIYKDAVLNIGFPIDLLVENKVIIELKAVEHISPVRKAQILSYMKMLNTKVGLLISFNVPVLKKGINRFVL